MSDLATTLDPLTLIPGRVDHVFRAASTWKKLSARAALVSESLRDIDVVCDPRVRASIAEAAPETWATLANTLLQCADHLERYADSLDRSQGTAADAIHLYQEGVFVADLAKDQHARVVPPRVTVPAPLDAGAPLRRAAEDLLADARTRASRAGREVVVAVRRSVATASPGR